MKKKVIALCLAAVMAVAMTPFSSVKEVSAAPAKVTVKVTKWGDPATLKQDPDKKLIDAFNARNKSTGIQAKLEIIPGDGYGTKLTTSFSGGDGYDVFLSGEGDFYKWVAQGVNQPLDSFIKKDTSFDPTDFSKAIYEMGKIKNQQYYLVKDYNPLLLYYSKAMFDAAKLPYPDKNTTWDQLFDAAKKLTVKDAKGKYSAYGFNATSWGYPIYAYLLSNGTDVADPTGKIVTNYLNSTNTVNAIDKWFNLSLGTDKASPTSSNLDSFGGQETMMGKGKLAMFLSGYWSAETLTKAKTNYGTTIIPKDAKGNRASILMAAGYCMSKTTKNPDAAYQVLQALTNVDAQTMRSQAPGVLPTVQYLLDDTLESIAPSDKGVIEVIQYGKQAIGMRSDLGNTIDKEFGNAIQKIVQGKATAKVALDEAVKALVKVGAK